jgi:hypothetical protein
MLELVRKADAQERSVFPGGAAGPSPTPTGAS